MYKFFRDYSEPAGAPSLVKFAMLNGITVEKLKSFRCHREFDRAYLECSEIRRDYLIDRALNKRFDASFTKYILESEFETDKEQDDSVTLKLTVVE